MDMDLTQTHHLAPLGVACSSVNAIRWRSGLPCATVMGNTVQRADGAACWECNGQREAQTEEGCGEFPAKRDADPIAKVKPVWPVKEENESPLTSVAAAAALSQDVEDAAQQKMLSTGSFSVRTGAVSQQSDISELEARSLYSGSDCSTRSSHRKHCTKLKLVETMGHIPSTALQLVINNPRSLEHVYEVDTELGKGAFGTVRLGCIRATGAKRAIKTISKEKMKESQGSLKLEIEIMKMLDHPGIVMLFEVLEDEDVHLSMELCDGCLTDRVKATKHHHLPHEELPTAMHQIFSAAFYLHHKNIIHRDLKSDNILLKVGPKEALTRTSLKVSDFGLSRIVKDGEYLSSVAGTPSHMAPEVHDKKSNHKSDIWSCGVILYFLVSGELPFKDEEATKKGQYKVSGPLWDKADPNMLTFLSMLLCKRAGLRYSARRALRDDWLKLRSRSSKPAPRRKRLLEDLRAFRALNKFKRAGICTAVSMLPEQDIAESREIFMQLDLDGDGMVSAQDLKKAGSLAVGFEDQVLSSYQVRQACGVTDKFESFVSTRAFGYTEFLAATIEPEVYLDNKVLQATFSCFDRDADGEISLSELSNGHLLGALSMEELHEIMAWCDLDGNMQIDFPEFEAMMRSV